MINASSTCFVERCDRRGFTFIEILAAMLFMAIVIPAAVNGIMIANRAGISAERKRVAAQLADQKLTEIIITREWLNGDEEGEFTEEQLGGDAPLYRWGLTSYAWEEDAMRVVALTVYYDVQGLEHSVTLSTLDTETEEEE